MADVARETCAPEAPGVVERLTAGPLAPAPDLSRIAS
jgi:hypothetical protein